MRIFTKQWYNIEDQIGIADLFEPVIDKEYSDEEFEQLYQDMRDAYIQEEHDSYDEPPMDVIDPQEWDDYLNREPFDEEEAGRDFDEDYQDMLEEPDEDVPAWIRETVDPRLVALWRLPEGAYKKLLAEEASLEGEYDRLGETVDEALDRMLEAVPPEYEELMEELDDREGDYVTAIYEKDGDVVIELAGWDEECEGAKYSLIFEDAEVLEDDGIVIEVFVDEDGDIESSCDFMYHEVYFEDGRIEVHLLMDDGKPKYYTVRCSDVYVKRYGSF